jgi:hypothetical protein
MYQSLHMTEKQFCFRPKGRLLQIHRLLDLRRLIASQVCTWLLEGVITIERLLLLHTWCVVKEREGQREAKTEVKVK